MPFLQKKPQVSSSIPLYTLGLNKTKLIVGLGNIGKQYDGTRHNIGFMCVDAFAEATDFPAWTSKTDLKCQLTSQNLGDTRVILIKPTTLMNLSGEAVQAAMHFYKIGVEDTLVVHDELDIDFGQIRTRVGGTAAGHNGVKSVILHTAENFGRVRIGIGPKVPEQIDSAPHQPVQGTADFVLAKFTKDEMSHMPALTKEVSAILSEYAYSSTLLPHETRSFIV